MPSSPTNAGPSGIGGGVGSVLRQGIQAAAFDKPFFLQIVGTGITTALSLQLGAVLSHARWPAVNCMNIYQQDLLATPLEIQGGYARTPDGPGLGIEVDEDLARAHPYSGSDLHLQMREDPCDYTNGNAFQGGVPATEG